MRAVFVTPLCALSLVLSGVVGGLTPAPAEAQATFAATVGAGYAAADPDGSGALTAALELNGAGRFGLRAVATRAVDAVFTTAEARLDLETGVSLFVPYLMAGGGVAFRSGTEHGVLAAGGGLRTRVNARIDLFAEARLLAVSNQEARDHPVPMVGGVRIRLGSAAR